jgi:hypothetical protein
MNVEGLYSSQESHAVDQPDQPEIVVSMQVRDEDAVDFRAPDLIVDNLYLSPFPTIDKVQMVSNRQDLSRGMPVERRNSRIIAEDGHS